MKPLSPVMRDRAVDALAYVREQRSLPFDPTEVITGLIDHHGASLRYASGTHVLRCAGIAVSNTANMASCLLNCWINGATLRLENLKLENFDD